jgi:hypothetical protein
MSVKYIINPWLDQLIDFLWKDKSRLSKKDAYAFTFNTDDLPEELSNQLDDEILDELREWDGVCLLSARTRTAFAKDMSEMLSRGIVSINR